MPKHEGERTRLHLDRPCVQPSLRKDAPGPVSCSVIEDFPMYCAHEVQQSLRVKLPGKEE